MVDLIFSLEATCDLPKEIIESYGFKVVNMNFSVGGTEYSSAEADVHTTNIYKKMAEGAKTITGQVNAELYKEHFSELLKQNKPVLHVGFSGGLSGTIKQAEQAANELNEKNEHKIYVTDSISGSLGQGLLAVILSDYAAKTDGLNEVLGFAEEIKTKINSVFTVDNLIYLARGGRLNKAVAIIGNVLNVKPILKANAKGCLALQKKVLSRRRAIKAMFDEYVENYDGKYKYCYISHADCLEEAENLAAAITEKSGVKPVISDLGAVMGSHAGPKTLAVFYVKK